MNYFQMHMNTFHNGSGSGSSNPTQETMVKGSSALWSTEATSKLVENVRHYYPKLSDKRKRKMAVWQEICKDIKKQGMDVTPEQVEKKWKNMVAHYRKYIKSGTKESSQMKRPYFFNEIDSFLHEKEVHIIQPPKCTVNVGLESILHHERFSTGWTEECAGDDQESSDETPPKPKEKEFKPAAKRRNIQVLLDRVTAGVEDFNENEKRKNQLLESLLSVQESFSEGMLEVLKEKNKIIERYLSDESQDGRKPSLNVYGVV